jgi:thiamine biosynthesis lipoprotein
MRMTMRQLLQAHYRKTLMVLAVGVFLFLVANQRQAFPPSVVQELSGETMGTTWHVQVSQLAKNTKPLDQAGKAITSRLEQLDRSIFSTYAADSELSKLNAAPIGKAVPVSREMLEVLLLSRTINRQSFSTFDITVGPLVNLWGFGPEKRSGIPAEADIKTAMKRLGADKYELDMRNSAVTRTADINIDLSAIAKGYAVDKVAELLLEQGFGNFLVEIGGEVRVQGGREPEQGWHIGIEKPHNGPREALARIDSHGDGFATAGSGDYRNFIEVDGKRYSHEINPRTGRPIDHALTAVTVLAATCAEADAWATAMMVLGPIDGPLLAKQRGMAVYFIIRKDEGLESSYTPAFEPYLGK